VGSCSFAANSHSSSHRSLAGPSMVRPPNLGFPLFNLLTQEFIAVCDDGHIERKSLVAARFADSWRSIAIALIEVFGYLGGESRA
jgi:hypothetical protein